MSSARIVNWNLWGTNSSTRGENITGPLTPPRQKIPGFGGGLTLGGQNSPVEPWLDSLEFRLTLLHECLDGLVQVVATQKRGIPLGNVFQPLFERMLFGK